MKKLPLIMILAAASVSIIGCGDDMSAKEKEYAICGKMVRDYGATSCGTTSSTTPIVSSTVTSTSTVTVTSTN